MILFFWDITSDIWFQPCSRSTVFILTPAGTKGKDIVRQLELVPGDQGQPGEQGTRGQRGPPGAPGRTGVPGGCGANLNY